MNIVSKIIVRAALAWMAISCFLALTNWVGGNDEASMLFLAGGVVLSVPAMILAWVVNAV